MLLLASLPESCGSAAGSLGWYATSTGNQISSRLLSARSANALLELPRADGVIEAGGWVGGWVGTECSGVSSTAAMRRVAFDDSGFQ